MKKAVLCVFLCVLFIIPISLIIGISKTEMQQYKQEDITVLAEGAYGEISETMRTDIEEYYELSGRFISNSYEYISLKHYDIQDIELAVVEGDEVQKGDQVGSCKGEKIVSQFNGIVMGITSKYIRLQAIDELVFETYLQDELIEEFRDKESLKLSTEQKDTVEVVKVSNVMSEKGIRVILKIPSQQYCYGQEVSAIKLYTGKVYENVLVVDQDCIYKKDDGINYIRIVNQEGIFQEECPVEIGYSTNEVICITGVKEGVMCDSGYKKIVESQQQLNE